MMCVFFLIFERNLLYFYTNIVQFLSEEQQSCEPMRTYTNLEIDEIIFYMVLYNISIIDL